MFIVLIVAIVAVVVLALGLGGRQFRRHDEGQAAPLEDERLKRLEQAVDAIALEVERIAEGQRFTTKLLAERRPEESRVTRPANQPSRNDPPPDDRRD